MTQYEPTIIARFWSRVQIPAPCFDYSPCWNWQGSLDRHGYGQFKLGFGLSPLRAHRIAYEACKGEIPEGMHVLHSCDNPRCCNPDHLRVGTHADNMADREARGRTWKAGIKKPAATP
jgi:hypothetical protein